MKRPVLLRMIVLVVGTVVMSGLVVTSAANAAPYPGCITYTEGPGGQQADYSNCDAPQDDEDETSGDGSGVGTVTPSCVFEGIWKEFCRGSQPCYSFDPAHLQDEDAARQSNDSGLSERPSEDDHLIFVSCLRPDGERDDLYYWSSEFNEGISTRDRLMAAYGALVLPDVTPVFNPPTQSLVNLQTWWWAEGASTEAIVGSEALGLVAIAEPRDMVVSAAGQTVTCPVVVSRSDACSMVIRRAGEYTATMRVIYDIRFELNGAAFAVPGGSSDLLTLQSSDSVTIPVVEVQSRVTELG